MSKLKASELNKLEFIKICKDNNILKVEVSYDGFGDSGQLNETTVFFSEKDYADASKIKGRYTYYKSDYTRVGDEWQEILKFNEGPFPDLVEEMVYSFLENKWPGWEINEGSYGLVILANDGTGTFEHTVKIEETHTGTFEE